MGEEWRRKWHPERIPPGDPKRSVLIVGAGPAGLECARALGQRGFAVTLAEGREELGGRVSIESRLPGLSTWARVRDYRSNLIQSMSNVDIYLGNRLSAQDVIDFECDHAVIATGARWTREILDSTAHPVEALQDQTVLTPDDILGGVEVQGPVVIFDFDHYYMGGCLAQLLRERGNAVTIVTPANSISAWTFMNNEMGNIRARMIELGVNTVLENNVTAYDGSAVQLSSIYPGGGEQSLQCRSLVIVGNRVGNDDLYQELKAAGITSVRSIGDCRVPGAIVHAVYSGHECARTIDLGDKPEHVARERPMLGLPR